MNGRLNLSTAFDGQKTVTEDLYFAPPFKVYSPLLLATQNPKNAKMRNNSELA